MAFGQGKPVLPVYEIPHKGVIMEGNQHTDKGIERKSSKTTTYQEVIQGRHFLRVSWLAVMMTVMLCVPSRDLPAAGLSEPGAPAFSILAGYGSSHPGLGETEVRVETLDLVLRGSSILIDDIGSSWYRGHHSLLLELPLHFFLHGGDLPMVGLNFLAAYTFTASVLQPYIFAGGGPLYIDADIDGMGSDWNGNYQFGAGFSMPLQNGHSLLVQAGYHHVSNGGSSKPNIPLNSTKILIGFTF
jgi:lipid A 3-O-deacylase